MAADGVTVEDRLRTAERSRGSCVRRRTALQSCLHMETVNGLRSRVKDDAAGQSDLDLPCRLEHRRSPAVWSDCLPGGQSSSTRLGDVTVEQPSKRRRLTDCAQGQAPPLPGTRPRSARTRGQAGEEVDTDKAGMPGRSSFLGVCKLQPDLPAARGHPETVVADDWLSSPGLSRPRDQESASQGQSDARRGASRQGACPKPRHVRRLFEPRGSAGTSPSAGLHAGQTTDSNSGRPAASTRVSCGERLTSARVDPYLGSGKEVSCPQAQPEVSSPTNRSEVNAEPERPSNMIDGSVGGSPMSGLCFMSPFGKVTVFNGCEDCFHGLGTPTESLSKRQMLNETTPQEHSNKALAIIVGPTSPSDNGSPPFPEPCISKSGQEPSNLTKRHNSSFKASEKLNVPLRDLKLKEATYPLFSKEVIDEDKRKALNMTFGLRSLMRHQQSSTVTETALPSSDATTAAMSGQGAVLGAPPFSLPDKTGIEGTEELMPTARTETALQPPPAPKKRRPAHGTTFHRSLAAGYNHVTLSGSRAGQIEAVRRRLDFDGKRPREGCSLGNEACTEQTSRFPMLTTMEGATPDVLRRILPRTPMSLPLSPTQAQSVSDSQSLALNLLCHNARRQATRLLRQSLGEVFHQSLAELLTPLNACRFSQLYRLPLSRAVGLLCLVLLQDAAARVLGREGEALQQEVTASFLGDVRAALLRTTEPGDRRAAPDVAGLLQQSVGEACRRGRVPGAACPPCPGATSQDTPRALRSSQLLRLYGVRDVTPHCADPALGAAAVAEVTQLSLQKMHALWKEASSPPTNEVWRVFLMRLQLDVRCGKHARTESDSSQGPPGERVERQNLTGCHGGLQDRWTLGQGQSPLPAFLARYQTRSLAEAWQCMTGLNWEGQGRQCWETVYVDKVRDGCLHPRRETAREIFIFLSLTT